MNEEEAYLQDVDRMVNEGLGGGEVTIDNGYVGDIPLEELFMEQGEEVTETEDTSVLDYNNEKE
ncbi:hypothetical protein ACP8HI_18065 [Paenibacillus sp. FA6]|uniref:hypothetical protein n=1 Tax=Paenibacillus sp. FA6 TaxID=3413029 RepID=UPI003F65AA2D